MRKVGSRDFLRHNVIGGFGKRFLGKVTTSKASNLTSGTNIGNACSQSRLKVVIRGIKIQNAYMQIYGGINIDQPCEKNLKMNKIDLKKMDI